MIKKTFSRLEKSVKRIFKIIKRPEMVILPGNISFALILSIFPSIMILGYIISKFHISADLFLDLLTVNFPKEVNDLVIRFSTLKSSASIALITFLIGLIFSSNGTKSIIVAANILYKTEEKSTLKMHIKSLFLVILLMTLFAFTMIVLGFGSEIVKSIINIFDENYDNIYIIFNIVRWPLSFTLIYFFVKILYTIAPSALVKSKSVTKGALFTTIGWIVATLIYSFYVSNIARYDIFYGSLSSIIVLMIWVYILSSILVIGICINADAYLIEENK